ncbi:hypothetical protein [Chryseobacterium timonianum]|uniref:hypothetical protein n=1 Tax=Chryseobacterium timonianum TaxID=1805473 RepID=UPI001F4AA554|nr:hypothetical protein [Chryseobacterium timonianum]
MMKNAKIWTLLFCLYSSFGNTQNIPACIKKLNHKTDLTTTEFKKVVTLRDKRIVYEFSVKSVRQCMDCSNGRIYYDENCKKVGYFIMGRGLNKFVEKGYSPSDFGIPAELYNNTSQEKIDDVLFYISKNESTDLKEFQYDDQIQISPKEGLKHFRKGKLINTYKIIPRKFSSTEINLPRIYYLPSFQLYFKVVERKFYITKTKFQDDVSSNKIEDNDWVKAFHLIKQKLK